MDLRLTVQEETINKPLRSRRVPSHKDIANAKTQEERMEIRQNDEVDRLAKIATGLPLPDYTPVHPGDIAVKAPHQPRQKNGSLRGGTMTFFFRYTLGILVAPQRNLSDDVGKMAMGK